MKKVVVLMSFAVVALFAAPVEVEATVEEAVVVDSAAVDSAAVDTVAVDTAAAE